ncbi:cache domain-containing sensor histidine kinase [Cohnella panacarvi]|uniref:cache domain-containing sensor histidine kinase n=1 Tax=Cohnella panacarvi TaxID=400776 RepID=UPI00047BC668|nr:sensor histidine kinase [Cohnella panacarvi]
MFKRGFSFRGKLIFSFILICLLPVVVVQLISYYISSEAMKDKINILVRASLLQTSKNLDTSLLAYEDIVRQIITNDDLVETINAINESNDAMEISRRRLINILSGYANAKNGIRSVTIFTENGMVISYDRQTGSPYYYNQWSNVQDPTTLPLYQEALRHTGTIISEPEKIDTVNNKEQFGFHLARKIIDYTRLSLKGIGVVTITAYESVLAEAINLSDEGTQAPSPFPNLAFLVNSKGIIVSSPDKQMIGKRISDVIGASMIINKYVNPKSGWEIYNLIDQRELFKEMFAMRRLTFWTGALAIAVSSLLIFVISERLSASIRNIVRAMKVAQNGVLNVHVENHRTRDEISHIAISFNKMMTRINDLMAEILNATEKQKNAEIRALEAQINPHFLYNTLDSINWLAIEKEEHQISHMLKGLAQILRYSIKDSNKLVTVAEELAWVDRYIYLQQFRFRSSFSCQVQCDDELLACRIPKLLIQPIIENAILHGFAGRKQGGLLRIAIERAKERMLRIEVRDNGKGMNEHTRSSIFNNPSGIGLSNVIDRIEIYYKHQAKLELDSKPGVGTAVRLLIPLSTGTEEEEG